MSGTLLLDRIRKRILCDGPWSFSRYMECALYDPEAGYYAQSPRLGPGGDFITAADFGEAWGEALARQLIEMDQALGRPDPFDVVEFGGGRGWLARDVGSVLLREAAAFHSRLRWTIVDRAAAMRRSAAQHAAVVKPEEAPQDRIGAVLAVEWIDAFPVDRYRRTESGWMEIGVGIDEQGRLAEVELDRPVECVPTLRADGAPDTAGYEIEHRPSLERECKRVAAALSRGYFLHVDYGERAPRLYEPQRRRGTLMAYRDQRASENVLEDPGHCDLTAHVNFDAVRRAMHAVGLQEIAFTTQDRFLIAHGFLERFHVATTAESRDPLSIARRRRESALIDPGQMGRRFKVQVFSPGSLPALRGLRDPFLEPEPPAFGSGR
jgi:SAM-dependent MidA family methyltransferase